MKNRNKAIFLLLAFFSLCFVSLGGETLAATEQKITLTVQQQEPVAAIKAYHLYQVAAYSADGKPYTLTPFTAYSVELDDLDTSEWKIAGETLAAYAARDHLLPFASAEVDAGGVCRFSSDSENLTEGIYLLVGVQDSEEMMMEPVLLTLPFRTEQGDIVYDAIVTPKYFQKNDSNDAFTSEKVIKVWENGDEAAKRPRQIDVQLLKNGEVHAVSSLSEANNWQHQWSDLDSQASWTVVEKTVPEGYTVAIQDKGTTTLITNTRQGIVEETKSERITDSKLPQAGMLWWPVQLLAFVGSLFLVVGWYKREKS